MITIVPATAAHVERIREIEIDAGERFRTIGLGSISDAEPSSSSELLRHVADGTVWVAVDENGVSVGYATASEVDGEAHLDQVSVVGAFAGLGVGRTLIDATMDWGRRRSRTSMTLTTFRDVAWNGPYYRRLGFVEMPEPQLGPELAAIRARERAAGIDVAPRVAMHCSI